MTPSSRPVQVCDDRLRRVDRSLPTAFVLVATPLPASRAASELHDETTEYNFTSYNFTERSHTNPAPPTTNGESIVGPGDTTDQRQLPYSPKAAGPHPVHFRPPFARPFGGPPRDEPADLHTLPVHTLTATLRRVVHSLRSRARPSSWTGTDPGRRVRRRPVRQDHLVG